MRQGHGVVAVRCADIIFAKNGNKSRKFGTIHKGGNCCCDGCCVGLSDGDRGWVGEDLVENFLFVQKSRDPWKEKPPPPLASSTVRILGDKAAKVIVAFVPLDVFVVGGIQVARAVAATPRSTKNCNSAAINFPLVSGAYSAKESVLVAVAIFSRSAGVIATMSAPVMRVGTGGAGDAAQKRCCCGDRTGGSGKLDGQLTRRDDASGLCDVGGCGRFRACRLRELE